jgi:hypothetical protein
MQEVLEQMFPPQSFLLDMFFKEENFALTESVDIDIVVGNRKLAPFVKPISEGKVVERLGYSTKVIKPPYVKPKMVTTSQDLLKRMAGMNMYVSGAQSLAQRAAEQFNKDLQYLQDLVVRREEWMAAQLLNGGVVDIVGEGYNAQVDFLMPNDNKMDASVDWDEATADPLVDLAELARRIRLASGLNPNKVIMGKDAIAYFLDSEKVQKLFDNRRIEVGNVAPDLGPQGEAYVATIRVPGLTADIYGYNETYIDDSDVSQSFVPDTRVWMGSDKARCTRQYAVIQDHEAYGGQAATRWFPKSWEVKDPSVRFLMLQSAPLPCLHQSGAFGYIEAKVT